MKKITICAIIFCLIFSSACTKKQEDNKKTQVYTSFYAIYDFAKTICGDYADVHNIVPSGTEPHDWEPGTQDMLAISNADVVFYNGLGMENWIDKVKTSIENPDVKFVELSAEVDTIDNADPHIWLDPENVIIMCKTISDTMCQADPENEAAYKANLAEFTKELTQLNNEFEDSLRNIKTNKLVVSHSAYGYMCSAYGLEQCPIEGIGAESEPSPSQMKEIIEYIKNNKIKYIFYEELVSPKIAQTISKETDTELLPLNPFEGSEQEEDYLTVMRKNLKNILISLSN